MDELPEGFECVGWYSPSEARRLMEALDEARIEMWAHFEDGMSGGGAMNAAFGSFGASAQVLLAVEATQRVAANDIHTRLFGDGLPIVTEPSDGEDEDLDPEQFEKRARLILQLDEVKREVQALVVEVKSVAAELARPHQPIPRLAALHTALAQHQQSAAQLQAQQDRLEQELAALESYE